MLRFAMRIICPQKVCRKAVLRLHISHSPGEGMECADLGVIVSEYIKAKGSCPSAPTGTARGASASFTDAVADAPQTRGGACSRTRTGAPLARGSLLRAAWPPRPSGGGVLGVKALRRSLTFSAGVERACTGLDVGSAGTRPTVFLLRDAWHGCI